jgi:hypothetical protein
MARKRRTYKSVIRLGAISIARVRETGHQPVVLDLTKARHGDLGSLAATLCSLHGIREPLKRGAGGKFLKRAGARA